MSTVQFSICVIAPPKRLKSTVPIAPLQLPEAVIAQHYVATIREDIELLHGRLALSSRSEELIVKCDQANPFHGAAKGAAVLRTARTSR
ncbi:hypothetical protein SAMN05446935_7492 [Burkholderia sp. YR290]|nr:hypothetical protein SAMN05446935_7492 [Burkholderia sp. YR290]